MRDVIIDKTGWLACEKAGVELRTHPLPDDIDARTYVVSANLHRRHLSASQCPMVGASMLLIEKAGCPKKGEKKGISSAEAAISVGVDEEYLDKEPSGSMARNS
jgi:hypothetical protein